MRALSWLAPVAVLAVVGACRRPPAEQISSHDAGPASSTWAQAALASAFDASAGDASGDGGKSASRNFCGDVFAADSASLMQKCLTKDMAFARGLARAASNLCSDDMNAAAARSRTSFDPDAARHCLEMLASNDKPRASMTDTLFLHYPCDRVLLGTQPEGQACRFSVECGEGLACVGYGNGTDGACKKPPKIGEECTVQRFGSILSEEAAELHHPACGPGAWCDGTKCEAQSGAGKPCASNSSCTPGLSCVTGKCGSPGAAGAACYATSDCAMGSWCDKPRFAPSGRCAAKRPAGAECPEVDACRGRCDMPKHRDGGAPPVGKCAEVCGSG